ncbi:Uncharacterized protein dnm_085130 [Desulfonema magnum]|uniref:Uncharacterized protein n=1 Tax=Desulfonema magnum TaxID=45655 RepID=A0A975BW87_9BACT|nr:Uncharacterized protein dnm_085130 [Desulfonema magnum]
MPYRQQIKKVFRPSRGRQNGEKTRLFPAGDTSSGEKSRVSPLSGAQPENSSVCQIIYHIISLPLSQAFRSAKIIFHTLA